MQRDLGLMDWREPIPEGSADAARTGTPGIALRRIVLILRRRWVLFGGLWLLVALGALAYSLTIDPVYRPQSTLEVRPEMPLVSSDQSDPSYIASLQMWANFYRTQESLLRSPSLIQEVLRNAPEPMVAEYRRSPDPVKEFLKDLDVEKTESSYIMKVGLTDRDPVKATTLVNMLVTRYLHDASRRLRELKSDTLEVLSKETLPAIRQRFDEAERALQQFQERTGFADFEVEFAAKVENRRRMDARLSEIRLRAIKLAADTNALRSYAADGVSGLHHEAFHATRTLETLGNRRAELLDEQARQTGVLKEKHPRAVEVRNELARVEAQIRDSVQGTLGSFEKNLESIREEEKKIAAEKARIEEDMGQARRRLTEFNRLDAELATSKDLYNSYLRKHSETRATSAGGQAGVRIVDPATVPAEPYKKPNWILGLGAVLGLALAAAAVSIAELLDDRLATAEEIGLALGVPVIGEIPKPAADPPTSLLADEEADAPVFEAYRNLRARLVTRLEDVSHGKIILVTSPEAGEGKSTVAANLARVLAMEDQRVLLFDAELRWPCMKGLLGDPRGRGLEELLRGEVDLQEAVQRSRIPGVDVLGADTGLLRAPEMAGSLRFQAALRAARGLYDFVVIDSAPVTLVSDTALVARRSDATVLVVRQGQSSRGAALSARKRLLEMGAPLMGAVVLGTPVPENFYGYQNRRDPDQEAQAIENEGDNLVGVV